LFRKHLFLVIAVGVVALMLLAGAVKLVTGGARGPGGPATAGGAAPAGGGQGGGAGAAEGQGAAARRGVQVTVTTPQVRTFVDKIEVLGTAKARQSVVLTAAAQQLISKVLFRSGDHVREGQVLVELKTQEQDAGIVQAESQVKFAKSTWDRWQQLADRGIAPAATAEQYKSQWEQAVANLDASKARLGDRVIRAPFTGTVGLSDAAPGMLINPGGVIANLDDLSVIRVDFPVPEVSLPLLKEGLPISSTADAYPATTFQGRIAKIDTHVDPATHSIVARAEFPNTDGRLKTGMLLHVSIAKVARQSAAAPEASVVFENGEAYVLLIQPAPGQGGARGQAGQAGGQGAQGAGQRQNLMVVRHVIGTGLRQDGWVEITSGLQPGQRIVADGTNRVRPNDPVQVAGFVGGAGAPMSGGLSGGASGGGRGGRTAAAGG
jgi:membrane fusion protein (multidrug efflux system)